MSTLRQMFANTIANTHFQKKHEEKVPPRKALFNTLRAVFSNYLKRKPWIMIWLAEQDNEKIGVAVQLFLTEQRVAVNIMQDLVNELKKDIKNQPEDIILSIINDLREKMLSTVKLPDLPDGVKPPNDEKLN